VLYDGMRYDPVIQGHKTFKVRKYSLYELQRSTCSWV